jgi:3-oxoacyl-[acyl-carrier-protein] synthase-1
MRDWSRQVVVTGAGVCCNMGDDLAEIEGKLRVGDHPAFSTWSPAVENSARSQLIGEYGGDCSDDALSVTKKQSRFLGRNARLALKAARTAIASAGVDVSSFGCVVGSGTGDVATLMQSHDKLDKFADCRRVSPITIPKIMASTVSANLANVLECTGPSMTATAACAGGAYNILLAAMMIESGHMDAAIAGGAEAADIHFHAGFDAMRAYNGQDNDRPERASRPYAADRSGFIFGEGAGVVVLESRAHAEKRGANILGALHGWGMSTDGEGQIVQPASDGACRAMSKAIEHAELSKDDIGYINTHGTATPLGDVSEVDAIRKCFGDRRIPYSSTKGYTGHTITGAGAIEAIFTLAMLRGGWLAVSVNAENLDPAFADYPPVREPTSTKMQHALSNSFGFGGTNVSLVLGKSPRERP